MLKHFSYYELENLLQVSSPLLMLDSLTINKAEDSISGIKMVSMNEGHFAGHFPEQPVMPGVLQVAAMSQAAAALLKEKFPENTNIEIVKLSRIKFRKPVLPGMILQLSGKLSSKNDDGSYEFQFKNTVDADVASSGTVTLKYLDDSYYCKEGLQDEESFAVPSEKIDKFADINTLMKHLPHRPPFLLVDGCYDLGNGDLAYGYKNISGNDPLCQGAYQRNFQAYLQIEAGAQLGCAHILSRPENQGKIALFMSIDEAEFYAPVMPGKQLQMTITCNFGTRFGSGEGKFFIDNKVVAESKIKFAVVEI